MTDIQIKTGLSRSDFLKTSGLLAAGMSFLPGFVRALEGRRSSAGPADYAIVVPQEASTIEKQAAGQLQQYLSQLLAKPVTIVGENDFKGRQAIYLGQTILARAQRPAMDTLPPDGYRYTIAGKRLLITGGAKKGLLYGVYDLLETWGFRRYAPDYTTVPKNPDIRLPRENLTKQPLVDYRTTSYSKMGDQSFADWHKISSNSDWGLFVHTFNTLVPPAEYGSTHPEYYSLVNGERHPGTQLCLSNPEVVNVLVDNLKKKIGEKPDATYWSVSQNDNDKYCHCEACLALNEKYGSVPSGSVMYFVNQVARAFPDKIISTLAYWYTRKAPKNIKAEPNVNIMLCNIESRRQGPVFETDPAFAGDLKDWAGLSSNILLWDYNIQFTNFFAPFPNLFTIKPNIKFYTDNHVRALYMQANAEPAAEMALLRAYLIYQLMWNPQADDQTIVDDFLNGYYGPAGAFIRRYIDMMHNALVKSDMKLDIFGDPTDAKDSFLSAAMMQAYRVLFDQAEAAVASDAALLRRVQTARLPIQYAAIQIGRTEIDTAGSLYQTAVNGLVTVRPEMRTLVNQFVAGCQREGVLLVRERSGSPEHFLAAYNRIFSRMEEMKEAKSFHKKITPITHPAARSKGVESLTDGIFASYESWQRSDPNWVYYTGQHMDFVLDLGELMPIHSINMDFLNPQAQPDWHLMALPKYVSYALSADGGNYADEISIVNPNNPNPQENPDISKISVYSFEATLKAQTEARYIRVHAESLLKMPAWHIRSGEPASIYTDEIVVK
jgi:hypothetical protein